MSDSDTTVLPDIGTWESKVTAWAPALYKHVELGHVRSELPYLDLIMKRMAQNTEEFRLCTFLDMFLLLRVIVAYFKLVRFADPLLDVDGRIVLIGHQLKMFVRLLVRAANNTEMSDLCNTLCSVRHAVTAIALSPSPFGCHISVSFAQRLSALDAGQVMGLLVDGVKGRRACGNSRRPSAEQLSQLFPEHGRAKR